MKKGQLSVEHLVLVGLSLVVIIPATFLLVRFAESTSDQVNSAQIKSIGEVIVFNARDMYMKGPGNLVTATFSLPEVATNLSVANGDEIVINYRTLQGNTQAVFFLDFPITGPTGLQDEIIVARPGIVNLVIDSDVGNEVRLTLR